MSSLRDINNAPIARDIAINASTARLDVSSNAMLQDSVLIPCELILVLPMPSAVVIAFASMRFALLPTRRAALRCST